MYAIYGNIYHQYTPVLLAYIPYMDPMGFALVSFQRGVSKNWTNVELSRWDPFGESRAEKSLTVEMS